MKINEPHFKELNKCLKYSPLKIETNRIKGVIEVKNFRVYAMRAVHEFKQNRIEVDIVFKGQMHAYHDIFGETWYDSDVLNENTTSKIRVYRNIRGKTHSSVENFLTMFFGSGHYYEIKKVSWE